MGGCATTYRRTKEDAGIIREGARATRHANEEWLGWIWGPTGVLVGTIHMPLSLITDTITFPFDLATKPPKSPPTAPAPTQESGPP